MAKPPFLTRNHNDTMTKKNLSSVLKKTPAKPTPETPAKAPVSLAPHATYGEKHHATVILEQIVTSGSSDQEAFAALDEAFELIEGIRRRVEA
jgi:hypothetical protein